MRLSRLIFLLLGIGSTAVAQQSLFQTGNGETSIYLRQSIAAINLGDSKASLGYFHRTNTEHLAVGAEGYATANSGVTSLFSSSSPKAPEGGGDGTLSWHYLAWKEPVPGVQAPAREDWLTLDAGYGRSSFYLYPTGATPTTSTPKTNFDRYRTILSYNAFTNGNVIWGIATGVERRNNLSNLKSDTLQTTVVPAQTGSQTSIVSTQAGYYGNYQIYVAAPIYTDILWYTPAKIKIPAFDNRVGLDFVTRSDVAKPQRSASGGVGIFLFKKDDPLTAIGGVTATYDGSKFLVTLTAGVTSK